MQFVALLLLALGVLYSLRPVDMEREVIKKQAKWIWQNLEKNVKNPKGFWDFATQLDLAGFSREFADTELMNQLTQEQKGTNMFQHVSEVFNMFDTDQSGTISEEEFMEFAYKHGLSRPNILGLDTHIAFYGSAGVGRSTLLNALIGEDTHFESGNLDAAGLYVGTQLTDAPSRVKRTRKFLKENTVNVSFIDTPASLPWFSDDSFDRETLMFKLMCQGFYKIFFVLRMRMGRISSRDKSDMQRVLDAVPIKHYGVIFNQVTESEMKMLDEHGTKERIETLNAGMNPPTSNVYFQPERAQLTWAQNARFEMPKDLLTFIRDTPSNMIPRQGETFCATPAQQKSIEMMIERSEKEKLKKLERSQLEVELEQERRRGEAVEEFVKLPFYQKVYRKAMGTVPCLSVPWYQCGRQ